MGIFRRMKADGTPGNWVMDYYLDGRNGKRVRQTLPSDFTEEEARRTYVQAFDGETPVRAPDRTVGSLFPSYLENHAKLNLLPGTANEIELVFENHICRLLGSVSVSRLTNADITKYKKARKAEFVPNRKASPKLVSNGTINKELAYFGGFLTWCREEHDIEQAKGFKVIPLPYSRPVPIILSFEEAVAFLEAADPYYRALIGCLYLMGLRINEARQLTWEVVDLAQGSLLTTRKGGRQQVLSIPPILVDMLEAIRAGRQTGFVFESKMLKGKPFHNPRGALRTIARKAGITKHVYPHLLRHTFATHMVALNENLKKVSELLGHGQVSTTEIYTHLAAAFLKNSSNALNDAIAAIRGRQ
jgi:site-specific recombinase XerD